MLYSHRLPPLPEVTIGYLSYLVFRGRICFIPTGYLRYLRLPLVTSVTWFSEVGYVLFPPVT